MHLTKWAGNKVDVDLQLSTNMYCNIINKIMSNLDLFFSLYTQKNVGRVFLTCQFLSAGWYKEMGH